MTRFVVCLRSTDTPSVVLAVIKGQGGDDVALDAEEGFRFRFRYRPKPFVDGTIFTDASLKENAGGGARAVGRVRVQYRNASGFSRSENGVDWLLQSQLKGFVCFLEMIGRDSQPEMLKSVASVELKLGGRWNFEILEIMR